MKTRDLFEARAPEHNGDWYVTGRHPTLSPSIPLKINGKLAASNQELESLKNAPIQVGGRCTFRNNYLTTLEGVPSVIYGDLDCTDNLIESLKDIHKQIKKLTGSFSVYDNPVRSNILGVLLIPGLSSFKISNVPVMNIINKHLPNTRGMAAVLECQSELIDAGFEELAEL